MLDQVSESDAPRTGFRGDLETLVKAHYPLIHIVTREEDRALSAIAELATSLARKVEIWSTSKGVFSVEKRSTPAEKRGAAPRSKAATSDLAVALELFEAHAAKAEPSLFVLLDPFPYLTERSANPIYRRRLRDFCIDIRTKGYPSTILIVATDSAVPPELSQEITLLDFPLPARVEIKSTVGRFLEQVRGVPGVTIEDTGSLVDELTDAALGLCMAEIQCALARTVVTGLHVDSQSVATLFMHKQQAIRKSGLLDHVGTTDLSVDQLGGLANLKNWLAIRERGFGEASHAFGITTPKGVLLTGVPGCGKSWSAKCAAASWKLPLVKLDMGQLFGSLVGASEANIRSALKTCEAIAPCVLWIDEIEKGAPRQGNWVGDSGVSLRVLGTFLTRMQEKTAPVFVFATANDIGKLVPEMLRKGRFDEIFFVDLPNDRERREILAIHLRRRDRDPAGFDLDELVRLSGPEQFGARIALTGSEIEAWVNESLLLAFNARVESPTRQSRNLGMDDFRTAIDRIVPFAQLRDEEITTMRDWASAHAVIANTAA